MAEILHPGVFVNEIQSDGVAIEGVGTSTAGFVGYTKRGPIGKAVLVTSWTDFVNKFAFGLDTPFMTNANLAYSVYGFFQNGGTRAYISRVASSSAKKAATVFKDGQDTTVLTVEALDEGEFGNDVSVTLKKVNNLFDFVVKYKGNVVSEYKNVSLNPSDDNFIEYVVNGIDRFVKITSTGEEPAPIELNVEKNLVDGNDGLDNVTDSNLIDGFNAFDEVVVNILVCPESQSNAVNQAGLAYAESKLAFYIADGLFDATIESIQEERDQYNSDYGALYFPWIKVNDPIAKGADKTRYVPVGGHIAGVFARTDSLRGVHKAPAGLEAVIRGALDVKTVVTDTTQSLLNPKGINAVRPLAGAGIVVWGARLLSNSPTKYVNVRRHLLYLRQSIKQNTLWAVFEPNDETLWGKLRSAIRGFLLAEYRNGALKGANPDEAFFVKCDAELNPQSEINAGRVNVQIGVSENKPGEFIVINISQNAGGSE